MHVCFRSDLFQLCSLRTDQLSAGAVLAGACINQSRPITNLRTDIRFALITEMDIPHAMIPVAYLQEEGAGMDVDCHTTNFVCAGGYAARVALGQMRAELRKHNGHAGWPGPPRYCRLRFAGSPSLVDGGTGTPWDEVGWTGGAT
jgi:hypothetical protein